MNSIENNRKLWLQIRRQILAIVAILDRHYSVGQSTDITINESDSVFTP